ncbi:beta-1,6-galactanase [bacterium]|nr:MAG: beta-1,6-galactanase [bacterium]
MSLFAALLALGPAVVIDPQKTHGTWEGWGTSLCWMGNVFGERDDVADLLFTRKTVDFEGHRLPGLGLNIVRYNVGACSTNEVDGRRMQVSKIILPYRQMEGFWLDGKDSNPNSKSWDWSRDPRQVAMMKKAKRRGANRFELFSNSPMWWMCKNDNPSGAANGNHDNLREDMHDTFAVYMATVAAEAKRRWGIAFTSVEPFNEPVTDYWFADCKQEGCHFSIPAQVSVLHKLRRELDLRGLSNTPIAASDETSFDQALRTWNGLDTATKAIVDQVNVHGYQGEKGDRKGLYEATKGKRLWNSEHGEGDASGLSLMRGVSLDFFALHPIAWSYWQPFDGGGWGLVVADMPNAKVQRISPKYFVFAHYTRHIRPGMTILETGDRETVAAYDPRRRKLVVLAIAGESGSDRVVDLSKFDLRGKSVARWITEPRGTTRYQKLPNLPLDGSAMTLVLPANSVQTFELDATPRL